MSGSMGDPDFDFTGAIFGGGDDSGVANFFGGAPGGSSWGATPGATTWDTSGGGPFLGAADSQPIAPGNTGNVVMPDAPGFWQKAGAFLTGTPQPSADAGMAAINAGVDAASTPSAATGPGTIGDYANKLKTALAGLKTATGAQQAADPKEGQPGSAWPWGRPRAGTASAVQGQAPPGLANMISALQARQQQLAALGMQQGAYAPRSTRGGLLGV